MYGEAIAQFQTGISSYGEASLKLSGLGYTYAVSGKRNEALKVLERLEELSQKVYVPPTHVAAVYAGLGDKDKAFQWLEKAYRERDEGLIYLNVAPPWVSLRSNSQFTDLTRRIGLPQ
jgi:tetratricopeptide (TPR) repeat protein